MTRVFEVEGVKGRCTISEFGWPPMNAPRRDSQDDSWQEQDGLFGDRGWIVMRHLDGPAAGLTFGISSRKTVRLVGEVSGE